MTERWQKIEKLCQSALELKESQRRAFLDEACAGDEELRREVESLLKFDSRGDRFIEQPALEVAAKMMAQEKPESLLGQQLGSYEILSLLGTGGMGVVYKARDARLKRFVAIKILPADQVSDPERKRRFIQEARAASALNHPNIITIHDIGREQDTDFIVMEYVSGKTLDQRIPRRGMRLDETLKIGIQTAEALAKAHSVGIIHRDLKPANVMVSEEGLVKVLDFGLAKLTEMEGDERDTRTTQFQTDEGTIVGTASYMSPEQAEGKKVDARSDIFSFGAVLYEMVTGQRAFMGESNLAMLTAILREEPKPVSQIVTGIPRDLEKIINRCLRKDRERRWQTMADVKNSLQELKEELESGALSSVPAPSRDRRSRLIWVSLALVFLIVAGLIVWLTRPSKIAESTLTVVPLTSYPGEERQATLSPDGNQVAFSWNGEKQDNFDIYVKLIGSTNQLRLTTAPEADTCPAWSPDGRTIAFIRESPGEKTAVYLVSPLGPPERKVDLISRTEGSPIAWTPDGKSLVVTDRNSDSEPLGLYLLSVGSGERRRLTAGQEKGFVDSQPAFSPDGRTLAFVREIAVGARDVYQLSLSEDLKPIGEPKRVTFENLPTLGCVWTEDGKEIVFSSGLYLSPNLFRIAAAGVGKPKRLTGVGEGGSEPAISHRMRRLVYTREVLDANVWRVEIPDPHGKISPPRKLVSSTRVEGDAQFSPDGKKIAFSSNQTGSFEIWICDSDGSNAVQLTSEGIFRDGPRWSPDGESIAFESYLDEQWDVEVIGASGGKAKRFTNSPANDGWPTWSRDGKWVYFHSDRSGDVQIWKMPRGGGEAVRVTQKGGVLAIESTNGQWLYYPKDGTTGALWKMPTSGGKESQVLESVYKAAFAIVEKGIYFVPGPDSSGRYSIQFLDFATKKVRFITTIEMPISEYLSVSPDGRWILYSQFDQAGSDLMLVENFR